VFDVRFDVHTPTVASCDPIGLGVVRRSTVGCG
jgi:hypothetical protein